MLPPALSFTKPASSPSFACLHAPPELSIPLALPPLALFSPSAPPLALPCSPDPPWGIWSSSPLRRVDSALAARSLGFTWNHCPNCSAVLFRPTGSTFVSCHSTIATGFRAFGCASSLHLFGSVRLLLPSVPIYTVIASVLRHQPSVFRILSTAWSFWLCGSTWVSTFFGSVSITYPHGVFKGISNMVPSYLDSIVGLCTGCLVGTCQDPPALSSFLVPCLLRPGSSFLLSCLSPALCQLLVLLRPSSLCCTVIPRSSLPRRGHYVTVKLFLVFILIVFSTCFICLYFFVPFSFHSSVTMVTH